MLFTYSRMDAVNHQYQKNNNSKKLSKVLSTKWYGETQPKYPKDSEANREKKRRVELANYADKDIKKDDKNGELKSKTFGDEYFISCYSFDTDDLQHPYPTVSK